MLKVLIINDLCIPVRNKTPNDVERVEDIVFQEDNYTLDNLTCNIGYSEWGQLKDWCYTYTVVEITSIYSDIDCANKYIIDTIKTIEEVDEGVFKVFMSFSEIKTIHIKHSKL